MSKKDGAGFIEDHQNRSTIKKSVNERFSNLLFFIQSVCFPTTHCWWWSKSFHLPLWKGEMNISSEFEKVFFFFWFRRMWFWSKSDEFNNLAVEIEIWMQTNVFSVRRETFHNFSFNFIPSLIADESKCIIEILFSYRIENISLLIC